MWRNKEQATYGEKMIKCIRQHGAKLLLLLLLENQTLTHYPLKTFKKIYNSSDYIHHIFDVAKLHTQPR